MNQQIREQLRQLQAQFPLLHDWFDYLLENQEDSSRIHLLLEEDPEQFEEEVLQLSEAIRLLPEQPIRFQDYSQIVTQDPQALEPEKELGRLFFHALAEDARLSASESLQFPETEEEKQQLLAKFHLIYDDLKDQVIIANLFAETAEGYHPVWESSVHTHSTLSVTMRELMNIETIYPAHEKPMIWVVENRRIFSSLLDEVPNVPMVCTQGNTPCSFAVKTVLDEVVEAGYSLRYVGELTPEGISKAEEWLMRYPETMMPWRMDVESYLKARLPQKTTMSEEVLRELDRFQLDLFACLKDEMKDQKRMARTDRLLGEMISELKYHYQK